MKIQAGQGSPGPGMAGLGSAGPGSHGLGTARQAEVRHGVIGESLSRLFR